MAQAGWEGLSDPHEHYFAGGHASFRVLIKTLPASSPSDVPVHCTKPFFSFMMAYEREEIFKRFRRFRKP
jgi:hypothetical protein